MVLEKLSTSLRYTLSKIAKYIFVDDRLIDELIKDIQRALLSADVNVQLVFQLSKDIKERALKEKTPKSLSKKEHLIRIVYEELVKFLGEKDYDLKIEKKKPFKIMFLGLFGSGKTTTIAKVAKYFQKRGYKIAALGLDIHRPAAPQQLKQLCDKLNISCYISKEKDPLKIYNTFKKEFDKYDILLIDTAGRDALSKDLIDEIELLTKEINPDEKILVISADTEQFHKSCDITSIIVTKMDGTAKAGGALTAAASTKAKISFLGVGEKVDNLEKFYPERFVSRLLGMGDLQTLLEKAEEAFDQEQAKDLGKKFIKGEFNLIDLYEQMEAMSKMGPLNKLVEMIPGFGKIKLPQELLQVQESKLKKWKFILQSMTKKELEDPEIISSSRIERIAKGSGTTSREVRELLKQYKQSKKMMKLMKGAEQDPTKLLKKFKGKIPMG